MNLNDRRISLLILVLFYLGFATYLVDRYPGVGGVWSHAARVPPPAYSVSRPLTGLQIVVSRIINDISQRVLAASELRWGRDQATVERVVRERFKGREQLRERLQNWYRDRVERDASRRPQRE